MGNSLRCCLACVLPCGALDLIRIVHLNGHVEELSGRVNAGDVLKNNPNHILTKPCSSQGVARRILILSPESDLKRGSIYFLIPSSSLPAHHHDQKSKINKYEPSKQQSTTAAPAVEKNPRSFRRRKVSAEVQRTHLESISEDL
ncbi:hypothetical protein ABFS82_14G066700 [Erythranthe guttata]|uniref:DUF4228 domain-containing protein n=1 Tax=Erythranthe guttata TaxID=4155 RepID=A0A022S333_ERYGU|nr:PREDICTED: uncharacterized protein LOC105960315 [Erythranthe guttata]EYU45690.1 hypothetical protein MIMGU_mgv1a015846mg [Erythranthe guttata]|eukprot:XP_012839937.1 PREDICTED: uncharacterized protein LOC105960315 [Erythranthe guttata]